MQLTRFLLVLCAIAVPSAVSAQARQSATAAPARGAEAGAAQQPAAEGTRQAPSTNDRVRARVLRAIASVRSASASAAALHALSLMAMVDRGEMRRTAELAKREIEVAHEHVRALGEIRELSRDMRSEVQTAERRLREASSTVDRIQEQLGAWQYRRRAGQALGADSERLHAQLADAERSIEQVAGEHRIAIDSETTPPDSAAG